MPTNHYIISFLNVSSVIHWRLQPIDIPIPNHSVIRRLIFAAESETSGNRDGTASYPDGHPQRTGVLAGPTRGVEAGISRIQRKKTSDHEWYRQIDSKAGGVGRRSGGRGGGSETEQ